MYQMLTRLFEENTNLRKKQGETISLDDKLRQLENVIQGATKSIRELKAEAQKSNSYAEKLKAPAVNKPTTQTTTAV
ncbi:hypothetical protein K0M31_012050 [Melipona bicolor]|uniref:Uncharacterized protein n=1 Tax=Melipona bicolor TaxID=60889 RepID=A0AA40GAQ3_9HYME|nr:hypothetical protein K0M31_012050 [Melipona bicolor]